MSLAATHDRKAAAPTFAPVAVMVMLAVGLIGFVGLGVLGAYAPMLRGGVLGEADALSRSAVGYAGLVRVLRESGRTAIISRNPGGIGPVGSGLLVLTPPADLKGRDLARLVEGGQRTVLVVLPKWEVIPAPRHIGWVLQAGLVPAGNISRMLAALFGGSADASVVSRAKGVSAGRLDWVNGFAGLDPLPIARVDALQGVAAPGAEVLLQDQGGRAVLSRIHGRTFVLADPDLLDNQAMATSRGARTAVALLDELHGDGGPVFFDVSLNGFGRPRSLIALALAPPFLGASICALAAALMMGAHAAVRFGPALPPDRALALGKQALLDNSAQLIALARREPKMGRRYAALVRRSLARRALSTDVGAATEDNRLDAAIDRLLPSSQPPFSVLAGEAERAVNVTSLMRAVRALHQRQTEILGEHR